MRFPALIFSMPVRPGSLEIAKGLRALAGFDPLAPEKSGKDDQPKPTAPRL
jgi:hypothetical protein